MKKKNEVNRNHQNGKGRTKVDEDTTKHGRVNIAGFRKLQVALKMLFKCEETKLKLHAKRVMLGARVEGMVSCACCGIGCLEIKCPFSHREKTVEEYVQESDSCLEQSTCNLPKMKYILKHTHQYYTQVQHQMFVTGTSYADFVLYFPKESYIVRVGKDESYHKVSVPLLEDFFKCNLIPELFSRKILTKKICKEILGEIVENAVNKVNIKNPNK